MTHLLHEVKEELDWAARELHHVELQFAALESQLKKKAGQEGANVEALRQEIEDQKEALNLTELYAILAKAARRFSLLTRVFEVGSANAETADIVSGLTDGLLFRQNDTSEKTDEAILELAEALRVYFHVHFGDDADIKLRESWLEVEAILRDLGRNI